MKKSTKGTSRGAMCGECLEEFTPSREAYLEHKRTTCKAGNAVRIATYPIIYGADGQPEATFTTKPL